MSVPRETIVFTLALLAISASVGASFGVLEVRDAQATAHYAARDATLLAQLGSQPHEEEPTTPEKPLGAAPVALVEASAPNATSPLPTPAAPPSPSPTPPPAVAPAPMTPSPTKPTTNATLVAPTPAPAPADRDGDEIPDSVDRCPTKDETRNGYQDKDGCPDVITTTRVS